jgi:signal transduction histidine kinase
MNVLANAIDALEDYRKVLSEEVKRERRDRITIATQLIPDRQTVEIRIRDNGPGIPDDIRQQIFNPFFTTKPVGKGTGLGMSISYQIIVEKHGGTIACTSLPEGGTEFAIELPISRVSH